MRDVGTVRGMANGPTPATVKQFPSPLRQTYQISVTSFKQNRFRPSKAGSARAPVEALACPDRRSGVGHFEMTDVRRFGEAFLEPVAVAPPSPPGEILLILLAGFPCFHRHQIVRIVAVLQRVGAQAALTNARLRQDGPGVCNQLFPLPSGARKRYRWRAVVQGPGMGCCSLP